MSRALATACPCPKTGESRYRSKRGSLAEAHMEGPDAGYGKRVAVQPAVTESRMEKKNAESISQLHQKMEAMEQKIKALNDRCGMQPPQQSPIPLRNPDYLARFPVPEDKRAWHISFPEYAPLLFSSPHLFTIFPDRRKLPRDPKDGVAHDFSTMYYYPPVWADPELYGMSGSEQRKYFRFNEKADNDVHPQHIKCHKGKTKVNINRCSYMCEYNFDRNGAPLNPDGRTGMIGRGLLGKYGPNHAADPVVTCFRSEDDVLSVAVIVRGDTGEWALPGGMVDPGEESLSATAIREFCEEALEGNTQPTAAGRAERVQMFLAQNRGELIRKVVDDPRNTDNAWMETQAHWFHLDQELQLRAGDDATHAFWVDLDDKFDVKNMYGDHAVIICALFQNIRDQKSDKVEWENFPQAYLPGSVANHPHYKNN